MLAAAEESQRKYLELTHKMVAPKPYTHIPTPYTLHSTPSRTNKFFELRNNMEAPLQAHVVRQIYVHAWLAIDPLCVHAGRDGAGACGLQGV